MIGWTQHYVTALLTVAALGITDANSILQAQQCPPGSNIIIDPRLVPSRPQISHEQFRSIMNNPWTADWQKRRIWEQYYGQGQPIQIPFQGGVVLVSPNVLCV
jgi:hypothetical protein